MTFIVALATLFLASEEVAAQSIRLWTWQPHSGIPALVIPVRNGESPIRATKRYLDGVADRPELKELLQRDPMPQMKLQGWRLLEDGDFATRVLLVANRPSDYRARHWRVKTFTDPMRETNTTGYMVPFVGDIGLTDRESDDYIEELNRRFPSFIGMGGDDVDWELLGLPIGESKFYNAFRDQFEIKLYERKIKTIREKEKLYLPENVMGSRVDKLFTVCRAFEIVAALTGHRIKTHIDGHGLPGDSASDGRVSPVLRSDYPTHMLQVKRDSHLSQLTVVLNLPVVTAHHQCVVENSFAWTKVVAHASDGCPEAIESPDGNITGIQGHFEIQAAMAPSMTTSFGKLVMPRVMKSLTPLRPTSDVCNEVMLQYGT